MLDPEVNRKLPLSTSSPRPPGRGDAKLLRLALPEVVAVDDLPGLLLEERGSTGGVMRPK